MQIERQKLLDSLSTVKPALATKDPMVQLLCIWFDGKRAYAYNNVVAVDIPFESEFKGGVLGAPLIAMVGSSLAKGAEVSAANGSFALKMAASRSQFSLIPLDQSIWEFPKLPKESVDIDEAVCAALDWVLISATPDLGVSFASDGKTLNIYASDTTTIAWSKIACPDGFPDIRVEVPPAFCEQVLAVCKKGGKLYLTDDFIAAVGESGARVFSRLMSGSAPLDYDAALKTNIPKGYKKEASEIPTNLSVAIDRALIMSGGEFAAVKHVVADGKLSLSLKSTLGVLQESVKLGGEGCEADTAFDVALIKRGLAKGADSIWYGDDSAILTRGDSNGYIVSALV